MKHLFLKIKKDHLLYNFKYVFYHFCFVLISPLLFNLTVREGGFIGASLFLSQTHTGVSRSSHTNRSIICSQPQRGTQLNQIGLPCCRNSQIQEYDVASLHCVSPSLFYFIFFRIASSSVVSAVDLNLKISEGPRFEPCNQW